MALTTLTFPIFIPCRSLPMMFVSTAYPLFSTSDNYRLDTTRTKIAAICQIPQSGDITGVAFNLQAVTSDQQLRCSIQPLNTLGEPSGVYYKSSSYGDDSIALATSTVQTIDLGTQVTGAVAGDTVAVVFEWAGASGDVRFALIPNSIDHRCSVARYSASAWSFATFVCPIIGFWYGSNCYPAIGCSLQQTSIDYTYNSGTSGADEYGNKIVVPFKCRVIGLWHDYSATIATDTLLAGALLDSNGNILGYDTHKYYEQTNRMYMGTQHMYFSSPVVINAGETVYITFATQSTTNITHYCPVFKTSQQRTACCQGADAILVKRLNQVTWDGSVPTFGNGAFTEINTEVVPCGLIVDQLDDGTGPTPAELAAAMWSNVTSPNRSLTG